LKKLINNYTFDASARTVTLSGYANVDLDGLLLITNVTDNVIIYNFAVPALGATATGSVITLVYDTSSMSDGDNLQIFYDDGTTQLTNSELRATAVPVSVAALPLPANAAQDATVSAVPASIGDVLWILRRLATYMESSGTIDQAQRQRIHADIVDLITTVSTVSSVTENVSLRGLNGVDTRYIFFDSANAAYNTGLRNNLKWT
jgi:hypothetical protein